LLAIRISGRAPDFLTASRSPADRHLVFHRHPRGSVPAERQVGAPGRLAFGADHPRLRNCSPRSHTWIIVPHSAVRVARRTFPARRHPDRRRLCSSSTGHPRDSQRLEASRRTGRCARADTSGGFVVQSWCSTSCLALQRITPPSALPMSFGSWHGHCDCPCDYARRRLRAARRLRRPASNGTMLAASFSAADR